MEFGDDFRRLVNFFTLGMNESVDFLLKLVWTILCALNGKEEPENASSLSSRGCHIVSTLLFVSKLIVELIIKNLFQHLHINGSLYLC